MTPAEKKRLVLVTAAITAAVTALLLTVLWITVSGETGG
jgi:hypothetical protein